MRQRSVGRAVLAVGLCALLLGVGCLGPSHATGRVFQYNMSFESKWSQEGMFILMLPAYVLFSFGDKIVFNSIYWWTGNNPIDPPGGSGPTEFGL